MGLEVQCLNAVRVLSKFLHTASCNRKVLIWGVAPYLIYCPRNPPSAKDLHNRQVLIWAERAVAHVGLRTGVSQSKDVYVNVLQSNLRSEIVLSLYLLSHRGS